MGLGKKIFRMEMCMLDNILMEDLKELGSIFGLIMLTIKVNLKMD
jgi:hypothetical protein